MDEISHIAENHYIFDGRCNREDIHLQRLRGNIRIVFDSNGEDNPLTTLERNRIESTPEERNRRIRFYYNTRAFYHAR